MDAGISFLDDLPPYHPIRYTARTRRIFFLGMERIIADTFLNGGARGASTNRPGGVDLLGPTFLWDSEPGRGR